MQNSFFRSVVDVFLNNARERLAFMAQRCEQGAEVMHSAEENTADKHPQKHWNPAEHGCLNGTVNGACACDGREMMAQNDVRLGGNVVDAVLELVGRRYAVGVNAPLLGKPTAVEDITHDEDSRADEQNQHGIHVKLLFILRRWAITPRGGRSVVAT